MGMEPKMVNGLLTPLRAGTKQRPHLIVPLCVALFALIVYLGFVLVGSGGPKLPAFPEGKVAAAAHTSTLPGNTPAQRPAASPLRSGPALAAAQH